jgi:hypothetical protein
MTSYAEHLGIDLARLEAERHHHYEAPARKYVTNDITAPPESSEDWQPITRAANAIGYAVETLRRWTKSDHVAYEKRGGRTWVYYPDVLRHAGKA